MFNKPEQVPVPNWLYYIKVDDAANSAEDVKEAGGQMVNGPMDVPGGDQIAQCLGPQGAMFAVHASNQG